VCRVWGSVETPGGYRSSNRITQPCVTRVHARLFVDSASHKKKKKNLISKFTSSNLISKYFIISFSKVRSHHNNCYPFLKYDHITTIVILFQNTLNHNSCNIHFLSTSNHNSWNIHFQNASNHNSCNIHF
jgi:hypothetical protein